MEQKEQEQAAQGMDLVTLKARTDAEFALTPVGQQLKQFEIQQRMAQMYAQSTIIPESYRGNLGNCVIALDMANRMGANPLMVMQNLCIVHGQPSFSAKFLVASINASGRYTSLQYEWVGKQGEDSWGCRCIAYERSDVKREHKLEGTLVTIAMARAEKWIDKNGSKWQTMPQQMLMYRAAAFWQRAYCPEITMGFISTEEAQDIQDVEYETVESQVAKVEQEIRAKANQGSPIGFQQPAAEMPSESAEPAAPEAPAQPQNNGGRQRPQW